MNIPEHYANEVEAHWRLGPCLASLIQSLPGHVTDPAWTPLGDAPPESVPNMPPPELVARIARAVQCSEAWLCLIEDGESISVCYPSDLLPHKGWDLPATVISQKHLRLPIMVQGTPEGHLDLRKPHDSTRFGTVHRQFAEAVVRLIGERLAYNKAQKCQGDFFRSLYLHRKLDSMLLTIRSLTEKPELELTEVADAVVQAVTGGLHGTTAVIAFWDENGTMQHLAANGPGCSLSAELEQLARERARQHGQPALPPVQHITRRSPSTESVCSSPSRDQPTTEVLILGLTRLTSYRGVLAVARSGDGASFSTSEKHALCLAASLFSEPSRIASHLGPAARRRHKEAEHPTHIHLPEI